jgi:hypothetical protein
MPTQPPNNVWTIETSGDRFPISIENASNEAIFIEGGAEAISIETAEPWIIEA